MFVRFVGQMLGVGNSKASWVVGQLMLMLAVAVLPFLAVSRRSG